MKALLITLSLALVMSPLTKISRPTLTADEMAERCGITSEEFHFFSSVVAAEDGACFEGQVLVAETVINRIESPSFPDTVFGVLCQANQFSTVSYDSCADVFYVSAVGTESSDLAVYTAYQAVARGTAPNVMYFNSISYCYGTPYRNPYTADGNYGGNYFSTEETVYAVA